jgi:hypothetical protein
MIMHFAQQYSELAAMNIVTTRFAEAHHNVSVEMKSIQVHRAAVRPFASEPLLWAQFPSFAHHTHAEKQAGLT